MDHSRAQDAQQSKGSALWHKEYSDELVDQRPSDSSASPPQAEKRPFRRVRSPSRPRAWMSSSYKPKFGGQIYPPRFTKDHYAFYKPGCRNHNYQHFSSRDHVYRRGYPHKLHSVSLRARERKARKESPDGSSPPKQSTTPRPFVPRSTSSRDSDAQFTICQSDKNQSRERDHRGAKSKEGEPSRDGELPATASQTVARDRAIQQKRRDIDEVYYQECELFGRVVKMLVEKDPSLEAPIQSSLQENLRDIGQRCVEAMRKFIEDYDSKEPDPHYCLS